MENLYTPQALASVRVESEEFLERLRAAGALDRAARCRPVRITATPVDASEAPLRDDELVLHLVRHGQGFHNLIADLYREMGKQFNATAGTGGSSNPYTRPEVVDPPLTEIGRLQARACQAKAQLLSPKLVVVSPLLRATQTALLVFSHLVDGVATRVPFVAHEDCHEIGGVHTCDHRRDLAELRKEFPMVDYDAAGLQESDPYWNPEVREPLVQLADRGYNFLLWLRDRPEREVAVVSHYGWLFTLMNSVLECDDPKLTAGFLTGELRSVRLRFEQADAPAAKRTRTA